MVQSQLTKSVGHVGLLQRRLVAILRMQQPCCSTFATWTISSAQLRRSISLGSLRRLCTVQVQERLRTKARFRKSHLTSRTADFAPVRADRSNRTDSDARGLPIQSSPYEVRENH